MAFMHVSVGPLGAWPRRFGVAVALVAVVGLGCARGASDAAPGKASADGKRGAGPSAGERKVPVLFETVARRDVPVVLEGLGTATPMATVAVRAQVDGPLMSVAFQEGAVVKKGQLLAQIDPRPYINSVAQTAATMARDAAQLQNAKLTLDRDLQLREQNLVAQQVVDDQRALVAQNEATLGMSKAANDAAKLQLEYSHVVAPIEGVAGLRQVDPGNMVRAVDATPLVVLTQLDPMAVVFTVPQDEVARIQAAFSRGALAVEVWSRDGRVRLGTGTLKLKALFGNPQRALWPNQFVKARLTVEIKKDALVVAAAAIQRGPQGTFVYVVGADETVQARPVEVDLIEGALAVMNAGLAEGERVVVDGQSQLKPGAVVDARAALGPDARGAR